MKSVKNTKKKSLFFILFILIFSLTACGAGSGSGSSAGADSAGADSAGGGSFDAEYHDASFSEDSAEGNSEAKVDFSHTSDGYFGVLANSDSRLKLQVFKDSDTFTYDVEQGKPQIFPLQGGDGSYTIKVMKNVSGTSYYELYSTSTSVTLNDSKAPYVRPNVYANYSKDSECIKKASQMAGSASSESDFVDQVYDYICKSIKYDYDEAATVESGYIPDPDEVMSSGKGICFDYASLAASMLRSQGIPTKIIFGYVAPDNLYHAWNMFYTDEEGWTTVEFSVDPGDWTRVDLTFSANGQNSNFIGDGTNYQDVYQY